MWKAIHTCGSRQAVTGNVKQPLAQPSAYEASPEFMERLASTPPSPQLPGLWLVQGLDGLLAVSLERDVGKVF